MVQDRRRPAHTRIGRLLRRRSLDELRSSSTCWRGDMSLVARGR